MKNHLPSKTVSVASAETASPTPFSATHSYGASSRPARTGSMRNIDCPFICCTEYRLCVPDTFLPFFRHTIVGIGSPRAAQKKLATPPTRTDWLIGRFVISGGSINGMEKKNNYRINKHTHTKKKTFFIELISRQRTIITSRAM